MTPESALDDLVTLELDGFDSHGTTRARRGGQWLEVEHGIPGETVRAEIFGGRRPRARIGEVLNSAADRVHAPCQYFRDWACGGCQWQHISYEGQLARKREAIEAEMREAGLPFTVTAVHTTAQPWRYRSTAGISLGKSAGFRRHRSLAIVPIHDCPISHPLIGILMAELNRRLITGALPDYRGRARLEVRVLEGGAEPRLQVLAEITEQEKGSVFDLGPLLNCLQGLDYVTGLLVRQGDGSIEVVAGHPFETTLVADRPVKLSAASFFQTNLTLLPELISRMQGETEPRAGRRIADVYGGVGVYGLFLAEGAGEVVVIERDELAIEAGRLTAQDWKVPNVSFLREEAGEGLRQGRYDVVIVDPPRSGLGNDVSEVLVSSRPRSILYVSCLAQSLARDLVTLINSGYKVEHIELFDFYPQTYHVELLAVLRFE